MNIGIYIDADNVSYKISTDLINYYKTVFSIAQNHKWSLTEIENMIVYEREVYIALLIEHIEEENARIEEEKAKYG